MHQLEACMTALKYLTYIFLLGLWLTAIPAHAFHLGISVSGDYTPSLTYKVEDNDKKFLLKGFGQTLQLFGTGPEKRLHRA
jgi:hypothetical protein